LTAGGGRVDSKGWPSIPRMDYSGWETGHHAVPHPHDAGVLLGGYDSAFQGGVDAVVSLCRMGSENLGPEHIEFWLLDAGPRENPNLTFLLDDAAQTIKALRDEGKTVLLHCVEGRSRTPSVAARYSKLLGEDPQDVRRAMTWSNPDPRLWAAAVATAPKGRSMVELG